MQDPPSSDPHLRAAWMLSYYVGRRRAILHLTVEAAARLCGLEISQWYALESGWVPEDPLDIQAIAVTLQAPQEDIQSFVDMHRLQQGS